MIDYIKLNCELPPLEKPLYDKDSDTWDLYFKEKDNLHPYLEDDLICIPFEDKYEADKCFLNAMSLMDEQVQVPAG